MAVRRPRVKASANLSSKRKVKKESTDEPSKQEFAKIPETVGLPPGKAQSVKDNIEAIVTETISTTTAVQVEPGAVESKQIIEKEIESVATENEPTIAKQVEAYETENVPMVLADYDFKCPQNKERPEATAVVTFASQDVEQNLLASPNQYNRLSSPVKPRQRIRPMPYLYRRNSIQGGNAESEDESRRHKTSAVPLHSPLPVDTKIHSLSTNRKRTESSCSNVSESNLIRESRTRRAFATEETQRISVAKKEFQSKFNGKPPEKSLLKMFDFIYYNPTSNPMKQRTKAENDEGKTDEDQPDNPPGEQDVEISEVDKTQPEEANTESSMPVPQLKLGPNGELVLDEKSLVIETAAEKDARATLANSSVIYVDENTENNGFYRRQKRTKDWTSEETIKFYRCLHTVGTDFSLMLTLFPNRSRRDLKLKFKKEEKTNLNLVNKALLYPKMFDIEELKRDLEKDEKEAAEKQKKWEEIKKSMPEKLRDAIKSKANNKAKYNYKSKVSRCMNSGDIPYENENLITDSRIKRSKDKNVPSLDQKKKENVVENEAEYQHNEQTLFDALMDSDASTVVSVQSNSIVKPNCDMVDIKTADEEMKINEETVHDLPNLDDDEDSKMANKFLSDVNSVLREIANGSLVVVSSEDPKDSENIINEIYVICKETGELSDEPLDLPEDVMQCILSAIQT